jgi:glycine cleavage system aminomethyltransferase T
MATLDPAQHRRNWFAAADADLAFYLERPAVFSPAADAQNSANQSRMLWNWASLWLPWEYSGWIEEGRSFHDCAFIGDWSGLGKVRIKGRDAFAFLLQLGTNNINKLAIGRMTHHVQVSEEGKVAAQGVLYRLAEDEFMFTGGTSYRAYYMLHRGGWDAQATIETPDWFLFSVQGPRALDVAGAAFGADLKRLRFGELQELRIDEIPVRVLRTGVTGELGYELHGPSSHANTVWAKVVEAGRPFGLKQLGARAQMISHVEAGIANNEYDFFSAPTERAGNAPVVPIGTGPARRSFGSYRPSTRSELYRTPAELNWIKQASLDTHDFIGRDALLAERAAGGPRRRLVGLVWNAADVVAVHSTLFEEDVVLPMEMPRYNGLELNHVSAAGRMVGCASSRTYSPFMRKMISLAHVDAEFARPGAEVSVIWGEAGGPQREICAAVVDLPFKPDRRRSAV